MRTHQASQHAFSYMFKRLRAAQESVLLLRQRVQLGRKCVHAATVMRPLPQGRTAAQSVDIRVRRDRCAFTPRKAD